MKTALSPGDRAELIAAAATAASIRKEVGPSPWRNVVRLFREHYGEQAVAELPGYWRARGGGFTATSVESGYAAVLNWMQRVERNAAALVDLSEEGGGS